MKRWISICLVCFLAWGMEVHGQPDELYARSAVLMDADTGRILFEKNGREFMANASTTKILTCILALEEMEDGQEAEFSALAASSPKVKLGAAKGERFLVKDLLYSLMLESHNDTAVAVAESIGGSVEEFSRLMNQKAKEIGCENTHFVTPNGLDREDEGGAHGTTAADLGLIMRYCIMESGKADEFLEITGTTTYTFSNLEQNRTYSCVNHNAFLSMMEGALTGKTGFTNKAGYCYVGALKREEKTFIVALLACGWPNNRSYKWKDTRILMNYGLDHYTKRSLWQEIELPDLIVEDAVGENGWDKEVTIGLKIQEPKEKTEMLLGDEEKVEVTCDFIKKSKAPIQAGSKVGRVVYSLNGEEIASYPILTQKGAERIDFYWYFRELFDKYLCR